MDISRRDFLKGAATAAAGVAFGRIAGAQTGEKAVIVGSGEYRYRCTHDWLRPPADLLWGDTQGVAQDLAGNIYISHTVHPDSKKGDAIVVFDKSGKFLRSWGDRFRGGGHGLDIRKEGDREYLYHCDTAHRVVVKTDLEGNVVWEKGVPYESGVYPKENPVFIPTNVALSQNGDFYITDGYGSDWITQYSRTGDFIRAFGGRGSEPGKVSNAHGIWVDERGSEPFVVVADRANARMQYFTMDGKHVRFCAEGMRQPCHFHVRGELMLIPDLKSVVTLVDKQNKVVAQLGDGDPSALRGHPRSDYIPGKFIHPHSAKFLNNGDILVVEWVPTGRVTLLQRA